MLFAIGTKVRFRYTGETGVITAQLEDGMLEVRLDSDSSHLIPAFEEDLIRDESQEPELSGAKFVQGPKPAEPAPPPRRQIKGQYVILKPKGVLIAFEPMPGRDGNVSRYKAWLVNDTSLEFLFKARLHIGTETLFEVEDKLNGTTVLELGDLLYDDLSDQPELSITLNRISTDGVGALHSKKLKIRPKQFFKNLHTAPILNTLAHQFVLFDSFENETSKKKKEEDLRDYTRQRTQPPGPDTLSDLMPFDTFNVEEFAHFEPEIDLHIEKLVNGTARLDPGMILRIQIQHLHRFMEKAIRLGVPRIFIIHGVGEGKLREAIAEELRSWPEVNKFKNEYHAKYGYGATEVTFH